MMNKPEILNWISTLADDSFIAIDDEGLNLVEIDSDGNQTTAYLAIGGVDAEED